MRPVSRGWLLPDFRGPADWTLTLDHAAAAAIAGLGRGHGTGRRLAPLAREIRSRLAVFPGFVRLRGFPVTGLAQAEIERSYLAFGSLLGRPVSQTRAGNMLGRVENVGADISVPTQRGHKSAAELPFHVDRTDWIGLLCVRAAAEGGTSRIASARAVHDLIYQRRPDLLEVLYHPFPEDRRGEELPGQRPWEPVPVFASVAGDFVSRYVPRFIAGAERFGDAPALTAAQRSALHLVSTILAEPGVVLDMDLEPGDLQLIDNYSVWHSRRAFRDGGPPGRGRLLLRLWLSTPDSPPLPDSLQPLYGSTAAGTVRGGVWPADGWPPDLGQPVRTLLG